MLLQVLFLLFQVFALGHNGEQPKMSDPNNTRVHGIIHPQGKEVIRTGSSYTIKWDQDSVNAAQCRINLHDAADNSVLQVLTPSVDCTLGALLWPVYPDTAKYPESYYITIEDETGSVLQKSGTFRIVLESPRLNLGPYLGVANHSSTAAAAASTTGHKSEIDEHTSKAGTLAQSDTASTEAFESVSSTAPSSANTPYTPQADTLSFVPIITSSSTSPIAEFSAMSFTMVYSRPGGDADIGSSISTATPSESHAESDAAHNLTLQVGLTVGFVMAVVVAAASLGLLFFYRRRARRSQTARTAAGVGSLPHEGGLPVEQVDQPIGPIGSESAQQARMVHLYKVSAGRRETESPNDRRDSIGVAR